ncbi:MAG TPA: hypothetical protein VLL77_08540 [Anaerolineales bacterium]|nr:hypothetical protein [Anaerolineales bacterium]
MMRRGRAMGPGRGMARRRVRRTIRRRRRRRIILMGGMIAWGTRKLSQKDVQQIEQKTGKPYEDLNDEEVQKAVTDLGIQAQPLDAAEQTQVQQQGEFEEVTEEVEEDA